ncbi:MAG: transposase [Halioglobus sp.]
MERKRINREFKLEAVRLLQKNTQPAAGLARELGVARNKLYAWRDEVLRRGEADAFPGPGRRQGKSHQSELDRLKRRVALLEEENAILKKAEAYFTDTPE